jgi:hypothetical protein
LYEGSKDKTKKYYKDLTSQNSIIVEKVNNIKDFNTKMNRDFEFRQSYISPIGTAKFWLFIIFYILLLILIGLCYFAKTRYELSGRIFIIVCLAAFPFFAYTIEYYLYTIFNYIFSFILNKPYSIEETVPSKGDPLHGDVLSLNRLKTTDGQEKEPIDPQNNFAELDKSNFTFLQNKTIRSFISNVEDFIFNAFNSITVNTGNVVNSLVHG